MSELIAALPMYDWPEARGETDALWACVREQLRGQRIDAPDRLVRRNGDMPAVSGGIRDGAGEVIAPDPATLPADDLDLHTLWRHPKLVFAQTCWGPMEMGLAKHVRVVGQPDYSVFEGGEGELYSSAILMRAGAEPVLPPADGGPSLPIHLLRDRRFAYNGPDSMSGIIALTRDLAALGEGLDLFAAKSETGGHRASIIAVAQGRADVCAVDCRTWDLAKRFEPASREVIPVGWTARRKGLPYVAARSAPDYRLA